MARSSTAAENTSSPRPKAGSTGAKRRAPRSTAASTAAGVASNIGFTKENRRFLMYLLALGSCAFTTLALASYSATDPAFSRRSSVEEVANWCGRMGALLADVSYQMLGWASWFVLPFGLWVGLRFARHHSATWFRLIAGGVGAWWSAALLGLLARPDDNTPFPVGGVLGAATSGWLVEHVGTIGSYVMVSGVLVAGITLVFGINWETIAGRGVGAVAGATPVVFSAVRVGVSGAASGLGRGASALRANVAARFQSESTDEAEPAPSEEAFDDVSEDDEVPGAISPKGLSLPPEPVLVLPPRPVERTTNGFDLGLDSDRDRPTVYAERELVQVEPDPSTAEDAPVAEPELAPPVVTRAAPPTRSPVKAKEPQREQVVQREVSIFDAPDPASLPGEDEDPDSDEDFIDDEYEDGDDEDIDPQLPLIPRPKGASPEIRPGNLISGGGEDDDDYPAISASSGPFELPPLSLLDIHDRSVSTLDENELKEMAAALVEKLANFNIRGEVTAIRPGPVITIFEYLPAPGIKVSRIAALSDDIAMAMKALRVRIVAPIPGKGVVGIEIPNDERQTVWYRDLMTSSEFREKEWVLPMALGKTPTGHPFIADLCKMPHLLVGGTTGSGKSVGVNSMLLTMLYTRTPEELRMILIDPKMLEFELYQDIPHLLHPVVTEPKLAAAALKWACKEMDDRYRVLARWGTRNIASYNQRVDVELADWSDEKARRYAPRTWPKDKPYPVPKKLPYIVVVIDELADLMMVASKEVEECIVRLAQKARACGIHLIVATQRPSVDVITGLIKANMPARIAFQVRSKTDGRTILDQNGAEALLGRGDMLYLPPGMSALARLHGPFVADEEVQRVADFLRSQGDPIYEADIRVEGEEGAGEIGDDEYDEVYDLAVQIVTDQGKASTSMIQRHLKIGYNRAARIIDMMEREGVVGPADGAKPRRVLVGSIDA